MNDHQIKYKSGILAGITEVIFTHPIDYYKTQKQYNAYNGNLVTNFKSLPLTMKAMKNRDSFSRYIYALHELVNKMLGKKSGLSYCDVRERYEHFRARCTLDKPKIFKIVKNKTLKKKREKGCTEPLYGKKSKCVIKIVPQTEKTESFQMDDKCLKKR